MAEHSRSGAPQELADSTSRPSARAGKVGLALLVVAGLALPWLLQWLGYDY
jgi:hypothetical protein